MRVLERCDERASIPQPGGGESLNVAMAGAIALYELNRSAALAEDPLDPNPS